MAMALNAYMRITGAVQGEIKGSVTQAGREDSILVNAMAHQLASPFDSSSGLPSGKRQHGPIIVTKEIDRATVPLVNAWANNENLTDVEIRFWQPSPSGAEFQYYTIELVNANVAEIRAEMLNNKYPENMPQPVREHVSFVYDKIIWTWEDGGITAEDDWETPVA
jgi:type VI secretion system secreted protein Hcp